MTKQNITPYALTLCLLLAGNSTLVAQNISLHSTPSGVYVEVIDAPTTTEGWAIQRVQTREATAQRYPLRPGIDRAAYRQRVNSFNRWFPDGAGLADGMADSLWDLRTSGRIITHPAYHLADGRAIVDTTASTAGTYDYQLLNSSGQVVASQRIQHPQAIRLPALRAQANPPAAQAELRWHTREANELWSAIVFRQDPVTARFERVHPEVLAYRHPEVDSVTVVVRDTTLAKPGYWRYYIEAVDRFGNRGPMAEVGHVLVLDEASRPHFTRLQAEGLNDQPAIQLNWQGQHNARLQAIRLYRSRSFNGPYELRANLPADANTYTDEVPVAREPFFYYLDTEELGGQSIRSAIVSAYYNGPVTPLVPQNVTATATDAGIQIEWAGGSQRNYGYVIHRGNDASGEMIAISPLLRGTNQQWSYLDSSRQLQAGQMYSYAVKAVSPTDEYSELSERAFATSPGEVFLPAPRTVRARLRDGVVILSWEDLPARIPQVTGYHLYRAEGQGEFQRITDTPLDLHDNRYQDASPAPGSYRYAVQAIGPNQQLSALSAAATIDTHQLLDLRPEQVESIQTSTSNVLVWSPLPYPERVESITLFRAEEGGHFVQLSQIPPNQARYEDRRIDPSNSYRYQLVITDIAGNASVPTRALTVRRE